MNDPTVAAGLSDDALLGEIAGEFSQRLAEGENPRVEEYAEKYPQLADAIREVFPALNLLRDSHVAGGAVDQAGEPPKSLGEFRILREIGRGGMGVVYEAEQQSLKRRVALKVLPFASMLKEEQLARFKNEAYAAASLDHEHIVHAYAVGCEQGVHYFAMQYVEGQNLADVIEQLRRLQRGKQGEEGSEQPDASSSNGDRTLDSGESEHTAPSSNGSPSYDQEKISTDPLALGSTSAGPLGREYFQRIATLGVQAAEALDYAHRRGVVHRDIKPSNLMLDAQQRVYITDFGLAFVEGDRNLTVTGDILGTLRYMSPEQATGDRRRIDHRTDIYSLGATLYELAALRPAFAGNDRLELLRRIADEQPPALRRRNRRIPVDLETIINKAMSKEPGDRYTTAAELAADLSRFAADEPIVARPPNLIHRAARWTRRHRTTMATFFMVMMLLAVVGPIVALRQAGLAQEAREHANKTMRALNRESRALGREKAAVALARKEEQAANAARIEEANQRQRAERQRDRAEQLRYASDMQTAKRAWDDGNVEQMLQRLNDYRFQEDANDLRGWEWYYLLSLANSHREEIPVAQNISECVSISPDGQLFAYLDGRSTVRLVHRAGREIHAWNRPIPPAWYDARLLWNSAGTRLCLICRGGAAVFDVQTGETIVAVKSLPYEYSIKDVAWSRDGSKLAYGKAVYPNDRATSPVRHELVVVDLNRSEEPNVIVPLPKDVYALDWSPEADRLAVAELWKLEGQPYELRVRIVRATDGEELVTLQGELSVSLNSMNKVVWSPDGRYMALAWGGDLRVWRIADQQTIFARDSDQLSATSRLEWSSDGSRLICASPHAFEVWDMTSYRRVIPYQSTSSASAIALSADGKRLADIVGDSIGRRQVRVWDLSSGKVARVIRSYWITGLSWTPDARQLVVASKRSIRIFDVSDGQDQETRTLQASSHLTTIAWAPDSRHLASVAQLRNKLWSKEDISVRIWDVDDGREIRRLEPADAERCVLRQALAWSPDGRYFAVGKNATGEAFESNEILVWDPNTWRQTHRLRVPSGVGQKSLTFIPWRNRLAAGTGAGAVQIWDLQSGKQVAALRCEPGRTFASVAATQNRRLLAWEAGHYFMTWDLSGERPGEPQYVGKNIDAFAVHPDGSQVATADDREIIVWRLENGEGVHQLRDQRECCALAWSPDGSRLASGSKNGTIAIWDTASGGLLMHMLSPEHVPIELAWSPDGNCLASAGDDGRIMIRDAKRGWQLWHTRPLAGRRVAQSPFPLVRLRRRSARRPAASVFFVKLQPLRTYLAEHPPALSDQRSLESEIAGLEQALAKMRRPNIGELAVKYYLLGLLHLESGQTMKAYELFSKAGAGWDEMQEDLNDFGAWHSFAWFLANCPQIELRDPERAVGTVDKAILIAKLKSDPSTATNVGAGCLTRALAKYRQGDWQSAIDDLEQSKYFRVVANSLDFFLLAMCHWQLGNRDEALDWYRQGVDDLCEYHGFTTRLAPSGEFPSILEVHRLRAEAESLIGKENIERVVFDDSTESVP